MIELPACTAGRRISPSPPSGPDESRIRSEAMRAIEVAAWRNSADTRAKASRFCIASKASPAASKGRPVKATRWRNTVSRQPDGEPKPVPIAVPPSGSAIRPARADARPAAWR
jgi:hypothetical protein